MFPDKDIVQSRNWGNLGVALKNSGLIAQAEVAYCKSLRMSPHPNYMHCICTLHLAQIEETVNRHVPSFARHFGHAPGPTLDARAKTDLLRRLQSVHTILRRQEHLMESMTEAGVVAVTAYDWCNFHFDRGKLFRACGRFEDAYAAFELMLATGERRSLAAAARGRSGTARGTQPAG